MAFSLPVAKKKSKIYLKILILQFPVPVIYLLKIVEQVGLVSWYSVFISVVCENVYELASSTLWLIVSQRAIVYPLPLKGLTIVSHKCH
jgi:hypothetical protein